MVAIPNSTLLLKNISLIWNLKTFVRKYGLSYSYFSLFSSFLGGHRSTHCFIYSDTCPFFLIFSLFESLLHSPCLSIAMKMIEIATRI
jgi:hypothetical protein